MEQRANLSLQEFMMDYGMLVVDLIISDVC